MISNNVSTMYLSTSLNLSISQAQSELATAQIESSSGQYADLGLQLGSQSGYELSLKNQNNLLQTLTSSNEIVSTNLSTTQTALSAIQTAAQNTLQSLTTWSSGTNSGATLQTLGSSSLESLISTANTTSNGQYVFGGINSSVAPLANYSTTPASAAQSAIDAAFTATFGVSPTDAAAANISASDLQNFLSSTGANGFAGQFQGTAWSSNWSSASSTNVTSEIAPGETIATSTNANQPAFQQLAEAYAMLSEFGGSQLSSAAQQAVATTASSLISSALSSLTSTQANVGTTQDLVTDANNSMSAQMTTLQTQIGNLDNVNMVTTASEVNSLTTQIQTAYELTAKIQQLSLSQYLPAT